MTRAGLENAIRGLVQPRLALTTIWAYQTTATGAAVARPDTPHALLNLVSDVAEGMPDGLGDAVLSDGEYLEQLTEDRYARCSVKVFGAGAWDKLQDLRLYLQTATSRGLADTSGIGISGISDVTDLTMLDGAGWEQVCVLDLRVHRREMLEVDEGYLEAVTIDLEYEEPYGTTVDTDTISADAAP